MKTNMKLVENQQASVLAFYMHRRATCVYVSMLYTIPLSQDNFPSCIIQLTDGTLLATAEWGSG